MRSILFKKADSQDYEKYVDIGYCERHYDFICTFINEDSSEKKRYFNYDDWFLDFQSNEIGSQLITLNYYLMEYNSYKNPIQFGETFGNKTATVILNNFQEFTFCIEKWFYADSSLFKGLDLGWENDELENLIESKEKNDLGSVTKIKFSDGSEIKFLDEDDKIQSFYVPESEFQQLKNQMMLVVKKFK
jgi:hypothetical protein